MRNYLMPCEQVDTACRPTRFVVQCNSRTTEVIIIIIIFIRLQSERYNNKLPHRTAVLQVFSAGSQVGCVAQLAERRSLAGELTLSCARPAAYG